MNPHEIKAFQSLTDEEKANLSRSIRESDFKSNAFQPSSLCIILTVQSLISLASLVKF